jgi:hypothetical protein
VPVYFFNLFNDTGPVRDEEGRELPDLDAAKAEAIRNARSIMSDEVRQGRLDLCAHIDVVDEGQAILFTLRFDEALSISAPKELS